MGNQPRVAFFLCLGAIGCWAVGAADEQENWIESKIETMTIPPGSCATFGFKGGKESEYRLNLTQMHFPDGCNPDEHLKWTPNFYYRGECLEMDLNDFLKCKVPSQNGIRDSSDMCENWDQLNTNLLGSSDEYVSRGTLCFEEQDYFLAMSSTCADAIDIEITVHTRSLTADEVEACNLFPSFLAKAATAALFLSLLMTIIPPVLITVSIILCCCFCPGCPCYESRMRRRQMTQNGQTIQLQTGQYSSSPSTARAHLPGYERITNVPLMAGVSLPPEDGQPAVNPFEATGNAQPVGAML